MACENRKYHGDTPEMHRRSPLRRHCEGNQVLSSRPRMSGEHTRWNHITFAIQIRPDILLSFTEHQPRLEPRQHQSHQGSHQGTQRQNKNKNALPSASRPRTRETETAKHLAERRCTVLRDSYGNKGENITIEPGSASWMPEKMLGAAYSRIYLVFLGEKLPSV